MSEWITDRLPTAKDADSDGAVLGMRDGVVIFQLAKYLVLGEPWQPLPAPYVKPKRWVTRWDVNAHRWFVVDSRDRYIVASLQLDKDHADAAQRIADIYNEVLP